MGRGMGMGVGLKGRRGKCWGDGGRDREGRGREMVRRDVGGGGEEGGRWFVCFDAFVTVGRCGCGNGTTTSHS